MLALRPRRRLVNFRLTEEEYEKLAAVCVHKGSPSLSDFARGAILRSIEIESARERLLEGRLAELGGRVAAIEARLETLAQVLGRRGRGQPHIPDTSC